MATVQKAVTIARPAAAVWDAVSDAGQLHIRIAPQLIANTVLEEEGAVRTVTFANGVTLRELLISNDHATQRLAWSAQSDQWQHHSASLQISAQGDDSCQAVWTVDVLPHGAGVQMEQFIAIGLGAMKSHLEYG